MLQINITECDDGIAVEISPSMVRYIFETLQETLEALPLLDEVNDE